jgi:hypothetical protein
MILGHIKGIRFMTPRLRLVEGDDDNLLLREVTSAYARPATPEDDNYHYFNPSQEYNSRFLPVAGRKSGGMSKRRRR